jgi:hypothetical protein
MDDPEKIEKKSDSIPDEVFKEYVDVNLIFPQRLYCMSLPIMRHLLENGLESLEGAIPSEEQLGMEARELNQFHKSFEVPVCYVENLTNLGQLNVSDPYNAIDIVYDFFENTNVDHLLLALDKAKTAEKWSLLNMPSSESNIKYMKTFGPQGGEEMIIKLRSEEKAMPFIFLSDLRLKTLWDQAYTMAYINTKNILFDKDEEQVKLSIKAIDNLNLALRSEPIKSITAVYRKISSSLELTPKEKELFDSLELGSVEDKGILDKIFWKVFTPYIHPEGLNEPLFFGINRKK